MSTPSRLKIPARYETPSKVFSGGQGEVRICRDNQLNREVAIKVIKDITDKEALRSEVSALAMIQSKHVVQMYDFVLDATGVCAGIVQEFLPGDHLSDFSSGPPNLEGYLKALYQISSGIADIHKHGKIHRDIKPLNMRFDGEGIIKIFDFALSCDGSPSPVTTSARGTDAYRAPELYRPPPVTFTSAVDVYAFGVTAWEMLDPNFPPEFLEFPPFHSGGTVSFNSHTIGLPADIVQVLDKTLSVDSALRPTMAEVRDALVKRLLFGKHVGCLTHAAGRHKIAAPGKAVTINVPGIASFRITYDGFDFRMVNISGDVDINNIRATNNCVIPQSCVLTASKGGIRQFLTFDVSHPEVVL